jgi:hypothetical protein
MPPRPTSAATSGCRWSTSRKPISTNNTPQDLLTALEGFANSTAVARHAGQPEFDAFRAMVDRTPELLESLDLASASPDPRQTLTAAFGLLRQGW